MSLAVCLAIENGEGAILSPSAGCRSRVASVVNKTPPRWRRSAWNSNIKKKPDEIGRLGSSSAHKSVRRDGKISVPLVDDVQAEGLTPEELKEVLTEALAVFVTAPDVTITRWI